MIAITNRDDGDDDDDDDDVVVVSVLLPAINCMRDFVNYHHGKWKYYINLTGQEFPLRTNLELVRIANIFNGSNDIAGSMER